MAAYQFDAAITSCGIVVENALAENDEVVTYVDGRKRVDRKPRHTLDQVLAGDFRLPLPKSAQRQEPQNPWQPLLDLVGKPRSGVNHYRYVPPTEGA